MKERVLQFGKEKAAGDHLPYARHLDHRTIETRDGLLIQTIQLGVTCPPTFIQLRLEPRYRCCACARVKQGAA